jgi:hypothetical protein
LQRVVAKKSDGCFLSPAIKRARGAAPLHIFDGEFAAQLIELGRADARARHYELCAPFADVVEDRVAA